MTRFTLCTIYFSVVVVVVVVVVLLLLLVAGDVRDTVRSGSPKVSGTVPNVVSGAISTSDEELLNIVVFLVVLVKNEAAIKKKKLCYTLIDTWEN